MSASNVFLIVVIALYKREINRLRARNNQFRDTINRLVRRRMTSEN